MENCVVCGADEVPVLGVLGMLVWYRCRACGVEYSAPYEPAEAEEAVTV